MEISNRFEMRCGEVFITWQKLFNFHCSMCQNKYEDFSVLLDHISEEHFTNIEWGVDKYKFEWDGQSEEQNVDIKSEIDEDLNDVFDHGHSLTETQNEQQKDKRPTQDVDTENECTTELQRKPKKRKNFQYKDYSCTICKSNFNKISCLKAHISHKHSDERNFKCDQCDMAFKSNANLRSHQRRHESLRRFECSVCLKKFYTKDELITHGRIHTGEKPFICAQCGKAFIRSGLLTNHMKRHNNDKRYKCEHCEKTFYTKQNRKIHSVVHTGERKYTCIVCQAAFARPKTLQEHMKIHINARENKCGICNAAFNQRRGLITHMKQTHKVLSIGNKSELPQM